MGERVKASRVSRTPKQLTAEIDELRSRLDEAEDALRAIREGEVDAIVVSGSKGDRVFSLAGTENLHRLMVDTMNEAGMALSFDGVVLFCNQRASALLQREMNQLLGERVDTFVASQDLERVRNLLLKARTETADDRVIFLAADGAPVPMQVWASHIITSDGPMISLAATDLSRLEADQALLAQLADQQHALRTREQELTASLEDLGRVADERARLVEALEDARDELKRSHVELEQKIKDRTALSEQRAEKLRDMASALSSAEHEERRRLAQLLHDDLQQILVAIRLRLSNLEMEIAEAPMGQTVRGIREIVDSAIASSRSLTVELSPPVLRESLPVMIEWLGRWFETHHGVTVEVVAGPDVREPSDEAKNFIFQSVRELLVNVRKHSHTDKATVSIIPAQDHVAIQVSDHGAGFDPAALLSAADASFGLFSIRERVEMLGGALEIESAPGAGSTFTIRVPAVHRVTRQQPSPFAAPGHPRVLSTSAAPSPIRILVVDDHTIFRHGLVSMLEGYDDLKVVGDAADGDEGVRLAEELMPDVVIMDMAMPRMGGVDATRLIKSRFFSIDVIALSFHESDESRTAMINAGASAYFTKSGPLEELIRAIRAQRGEEPRAGTPRNNGAPVEPPAPLQ